MRNIVLLFMLSLFFLGGCVTSTNTSFHLSTEAAVYNSGCVKFYIDNTYFKGTGVAISPDLILTANHVVSSSPDLTVDGQKIEILLQNEIYDLAVVKLTNHKHPIAKLSKNLIFTNDSIRIKGYYGFKFTAIPGVFSGKVVTDSLEIYTIINSGNAPGMSGSPCFNENNEVVGIDDMSLAWSSDINNVTSMFPNPSATGIVNILYFYDMWAEYLEKNPDVQEKF